MPYIAVAKNKMLDSLTGVANTTPAITHVSLHTGFPATAANEVTGGTPAYARLAIAFAAAANGVADDTAVSRVFDVPGGVTVAAVGFWSAVTAGTLLADADVVDEAFAAQGTYTLTDAKLDLNAV